MPYYPRPLAIVATRIATTEDELRELASHQWISITEAGGALFISGRNEYKARFVLDLRHKLGLPNKEIERVLEVEEPPYSLKDVPAILGHKVKRS